MNNSTLQLKIKERLNKLDSRDYDNIECWQITEAFNKATVEWCRRQLVGTNILKQGDEQSVRRIDDLNILLKEVPLTMSDKGLYDESNTIPPDFFQYKRLQVTATSDCCADPLPMVIYEAEESNVPHYLSDEYRKPSLEWGETIATFVGKKIRIYTNKEFHVEAKLMYYRQPRRIQITGCQDPYTGLTPTADIISEFKDDVVEVIIDDAGSILAGDIENILQNQRLKQNSEQNN